MNLITGTNKAFPLKPARTHHLSLTRLKEAIAALSFDAHHAGGGLFIVTLHAGKINVGRFDNVTTTKTSVPYNVDTLNEIIDSTAFHIKYSMGNPELYSLGEKFSKCPGKLLLIALATPVDIHGNVVADSSPDVYGWDILIYTIDEADIDVFCVKGEPLAGTVSVTSSGFLRSAILPYLYYTPARQVSLWRLYALVTGKELPRFLFEK